MNHDPDDLATEALERGVSVNTVRHNRSRAAAYEASEQASAHRRAVAEQHGVHSPEYRKASAAAQAAYADYIAWVKADSLAAQAGAE